MQPQATVLHFIAQESQNVCVLGTLKERLTFMLVQLCLIRKKKSACEVTSGFCGGLISSSRQDAALITT